MKSKKAILIIGSPKLTGSTSEKLGSFFLSQLNEQNFEVEKVNVNVFTRNNALSELVKKVNQSDLLVISTPLYVDSLPAPLISFLEVYRNDNNIPIRKMVAIVNSGFPESSQNNPAIEILRLFAKKNNFDWLGGFAIGGGGAFTTKDIGKTKSARNISESFKNASIFLAENKPIPNYLFSKASTPLIPKWMYTFFGRVGWIVQSIKHKSFFKLHARPYSG